MHRIFRNSGIILQIRTAVTATAAKPASPFQSVVSTSEEGFNLTCLSQPPLWPGLSRVAVVFNAGSRYEMNGKDRGITHLIRRSCGLSTTDFTAVNLTRHFQQMGARVACYTTREHMIYTVDVAPNLASRAGYLLAEMATGVAYYHWELKSVANKLMLRDIDLLQRRQFPALCMELLHEAAFGLSPSGSGLGNCLFAPVDRVGSYSYEQIEQFHRHFFTPCRCTLALVGHEPGQDGMELLREIKGGLKVRPPQAIPEKTGKSHGFIGGDVRRDLAAAPHVYANVAWPTSGLYCPHKLAIDLAVCLTTGSTGRVSYGGVDESTDDTQLAAFHKAYDGFGMFGLSVFGYSAKAVEDRLIRAIHALRKAKITLDELRIAKSLYRADLSMIMESPAALAVDLAVQVSRSGKVYHAPLHRAAAIDNISTTEVKEALNKVLSSPIAALSVVGPEASEILPVQVLLS
ncbi:unnamed protein product, partial [Dicrocoelium dendriticum]